MYRNDNPPGGCHDHERMQLYNPGLNQNKSYKLVHTLKGCFLPFGHVCYVISEAGVAPFHVRGSSHAFIYIIINPLCDICHVQSPHARFLFRKPPPSHRRKPHGKNPSQFSMRVFSRGILSYPSLLVLC